MVLSDVQPPTSNMLDLTFYPPPGAFRLQPIFKVMESRGWKPACPPRVPDEELTTPYVDSWEESQDIDSFGQRYLRSNEPHRSILPAVAAADAGEGNGSVGPFSGDMPATAVPAPQLEKDSAPHPAKVSQAWDLHWSYTKWAVETMRFARNLTPWQKVNHFRNSNELCRKVGVCG